MAGNTNCLGGIGHFRMKNIFPIFTQPFVCGDRKEDGRVCARFLQLRRYSQVVEKLASQARRRTEAEKNGKLNSKKRDFSLWTFFHENLVARLMENTVEREARETSVEHGMRGREKTYWGEVVKLAIEFVLCDCILILVMNEFYKT